MAAHFGLCEHDDETDDFDLGDDFDNNTDDLGSADDDASCTAEDCATLGDALTAAGVPHEIELYPGATHGFAVPDFTVYDAAAAARLGDKVLALFAATLGA
jgi:carboxymethylenebutenolidase